MTIMRARSCRGFETAGAGSRWSDSGAAFSNVDAMFLFISPVDVGIFHHHRVKPKNVARASETTRQQQESSNERADRSRCNNSNL